MLQKVGESLSFLTAMCQFSHRVAMSICQNVCLFAASDSVFFGLSSALRSHENELEVMERSLLKYILQAHSKVQNKLIYLETGVLNIEPNYILKKNDLFADILKRSYSQLTRTVYAQKKNPLKGDLYKLIKNDS